MSQLSFDTILTATKSGLPPNSNRVVLPVSALSHILDQATALGLEIPHPLALALNNSRNGKKLYVGIREFTALESTIELPEHVFHTLDAQPGDKIQTTLAALPKGTSVKLRPLNAEYEDEDIKSLLESELRRNYTTLTVGEIISVQTQDQKIQFLIGELEPENAVSIVDTDLNTDIEPLNEEDAKKTMSKRAKNILNSIKLDQEITGEIEANDYMYFELGQFDRNKAIRIQKKGSEMEMYIQFGSKPREDDALVSSLSMKPESSLEIVARDFATSNDSKLVIGLRSPIKQNFSIVVSQRPIEITNGSADGKQKCENCGQHISIQSMTMHSAFCMRNNVKCPHCETVLKKNSPEVESHWHCPLCNDYTNWVSEEVIARHNSHCHTSRECTCGEVFASQFELAFHRATECPKKLTKCRFCGLSLPAGLPPTDGKDILLGLTGHEAECGGRTTECIICGKFVRIKDLGIHEMGHDQERRRQVTPNICRNENCVRKRGDNKLLLCDICFGLLWAPGHDPDGSKLSSRLERRLLNQLITGCHRPWCRNKFCATGSGTKLGMVTANETVKQTVKNLNNTQTAINLCVDEGTTRKRILAQLAYEDLNGVYDIRWCDSAAEHVGLNGNIGEVREWLIREAVRIDEQ